MDLNALWQTAESTDLPTLASFGQTIDLLDAQVESDQSVVNVRLQWHIVDPPVSPLAVFVHLYGPDGSLVAQADGPPGQGFVPISLWQPGDQLSDSYELAVDRTSLPVGSYSVRVGVYDPQTSLRLPATANGRSVTDDAVEIGRVELEN